MSVFSPARSRATFPPARSRATGRARRLGAVATLSALALLPLGCSSSSPDAPAASADAVRMSDQWIKAADSGMSAAFGVLENSSDQDVTLVAASSPASNTVEIHEVVADAQGDKTMREKEGGLTIPAHGSATLKPGGEHLMFIGLKEPLRTGAETPITLTFADGSSTTVSAQVRDFVGGKENYEPSGATTAPAHGG
ncbi:copper chaperone PCu(A)C [Nocardia otitidiscaviarum]|uniref:copper chaperone PCu(A)C n=1 Tax=Nocardia otitidiscaviarum TaxID=1823 RepID=UPI0009E01099|nr:copper chaperone PCu(A)C [Nocardia otitidiscaviarum]MBF6136498.1 copper chaperone PCu(A)C [Nocardia otitidiscaviarum]MBF6484700.1 copper chaperone PCu(A)C [Nocardia otitidiscaviarum]